MDQPTTSPSTTTRGTATLDRERTDQLRTFLTVEAAASVAAHRSARAHPRGGRRTLAGVAAAVLLGGGIFAVNAVVGGPGPAAVDPAVAIESSDGWTTVRLLDADADPQAVVDELADAGIEARIADPGDVADQGFLLAFTGGAPPTEGSGTAVVDHHDLQLSVSLPSPFPDFADPGVEGPAFQAAFEAELEDLGVRIGDHEVSFRSDTEQTVLVYAEA